MSITSASGRATTRETVQSASFQGRLTRAREAAAQKPGFTRERESTSAGRMHEREPRGSVSFNDYQQQHTRRLSTSLQKLTGVAQARKPSFSPSGAVVAPPARGSCSSDDDIPESGSSDQLRRVGIMPIAGSLPAPARVPSMREPNAVSESQHMLSWSGDQKLRQVQVSLEGRIACVSENLDRRMDEVSEHVERQIQRVVAMLELRR